MKLSRKVCRSCGDNTFIRLDQLVEVDPFFAKYGLQISSEESLVIHLYDWGLRRKVSWLPTRLANKLHQQLDGFRSKNLLFTKSIKIPYGICEHCEFLAPWYEVGDDQLRDYYSYYLKAEYKQARTSFQPGFAALGEVMGSAAEAELRRQQHEAFLAPHLESMRSTTADGTIRLLDYGGGQGLIIPRLPGVVGEVLDVESAEQARETSKRNRYDVVQCLHVLEHVGHPGKTFQRLLYHCRKGGIIYVEVPIEHPGLAQIHKGNLPICHEHINKLNLNVIRGLLAANSVDILLLEEDFVDFLHLDGLTPVIRALARKCSE
jgi:SAM-dependent methyltransferase